MVCRRPGQLRDPDQAGEALKNWASDPYAPSWGESTREAPTHAPPGNLGSLEKGH